jgi:hypothetical protein
MSSQHIPPNSHNDNQPQQDPKWLEEIQHLADEILGASDNGSACDQVHPIVARWYDEMLEHMEDEAVEDRPSVWQAVSCLATEIMLDAEMDEGLAPLLETVDEDMLGMWIEHILMVGRSLEADLRDGKLDDL